MDARDITNRTPLHRAASSGHTAAVQELPEAGADASLEDEDGLTALDNAVKYCDSDDSEDQGQTEVAACIQQAVEEDEALRLCAAQQRLALATVLVPSAAEPTVGGLSQLADDLLHLSGETLWARPLGLPGSERIALQIQVLARALHAYM